MLFGIAEEVLDIQTFKGTMSPLLGKFDIKNQDKALAFHPADPPAAPVDACTCKIPLDSTIFPIFKVLSVIPVPSSAFEILA